MTISVYGTHRNGEYADALLAGCAQAGVEVRDHRDKGFFGQCMAFQRDVPRPSVLFVVSDRSAALAVVLRVLGEIPIVWAPVREYGEMQGPSHESLGTISGWLGSWAADLILLDVRAAAVRFVRKYSAKQSELLWLDDSTGENLVDRFLAAISLLVADGSLESVERESDRKT